MARVNGNFFEQLGELVEGDLMKWLGHGLDPPLGCRKVRNGVAVSRWCLLRPGGMLARPRFAQRVSRLTVA
jgi:hypothetical protein